MTRHLMHHCALRPGRPARALQRRLAADDGLVAAVGEALHDVAAGDEQE